MATFQEQEETAHLDPSQEAKDDPRQRLLQINNDDHHQVAFWNFNNFICGISVLPVTFAVIVLAALAVNYGIAVKLNHVSPFLPYVSWLASKSPEQYIFDFMFSLASINISFLIYMKFKAVSSVIGEHPWMWPFIVVFNKICAWMGLATGFFFLISTTFPSVEEAAIAKVHSIASITAFSILCVYFIIESTMCFFLRNRIPGVTTCLCITRSVIAGLCTCGLVLSGTTGKLSYNKFKGKNDKKWRSSDGGYTLHLIAALSEWSIILLMVVFFLTYIIELKQLRSQVRVANKQNDTQRVPSL